MSDVASYTYDQIHLGQKVSFSVVITDEMMSGFLDISGDCNPLHMDKDFAKQGGYSDRVVYGMLTASFLSTLAGVHLPGKNSIIHGINIKFSKPVYIGETIKYIGEVIRKDDKYRVIELKISALNGSGEKVLRGKMTIGVLA